MPEKRIRVWVQPFRDRPHLMLQWHDPVTGKRRSRSSGTADPAEAEEQRIKLHYELNHGRHEEASRMSWAAFRELFEDEAAAAKRPNTRKNYRDAFDSFEKLCAPRTLRGVTHRTVSLFAAALRKEKGRGEDGRACASSVKTRLQFLRAALRWAAAQKLIPECPAFPAVKVPRKKPQPVPAESFERLYAAAPDDATRAFLLAGWLAGLRLHEAWALEWEETDAAPWLDFGRDRVWLPAGFVKATEDQWVPLDPLLRAALEGLPRHGRRVFRFLGPGGRPVQAPAVGKRVVALARRCGVRLTMRTLRRGFGCRYAGQVPAQVLQKLMRHSNIGVTMGYYANVDAAVEEAVLGRKPPRNTSRNAAAEGGEKAR